MVTTHGAEMPGESESLDGAAATGDAEGAQPPSVGGAVAEVRVTVIPAHSPVGETSGKGSGGQRFLVCDFGAEDSREVLGGKTEVWSFATIKEARIHSAQRRDLGHHVRIIGPGKLPGKRRKGTLNERLAGREDD